MCFSKKYSINYILLPRSSLFRLIPSRRDQKRAMQSTASSSASAPPPSSMFGQICGFNDVAIVRDPRWRFTEYLRDHLLYTDYAREVYRQLPGTRPPRKDMMSTQPLFGD
jgi:hypothetical protein